MQRLVELDLLLGGELRGARPQVEAHDARAREQLDVLLAPPLVGAEQRLLAGLLAAEVALGAVRAVVRRVELAPDEQDLALGAFLAQPARAVGRGKAAADEQVVDLAGGHGGSLQPWGAVHFWAIGEFVIKNADYPNWDTLAKAMAEHIRYRNGPHRDHRLIQAERRLLIAA